MAEFPDAFSPLVVVVGDRREPRPKTRGDLLAYSVSTVDLLFLNWLVLPPETLILSDKVFVQRDKQILRQKFGEYNILTIGSPAVNLFSRMINDKSLYRFHIDENAKEQMTRQERIVDSMNDAVQLGMYKFIVDLLPLDPDDIRKAFRDQVSSTRQDEKNFAKILDKVCESGLRNYKELLRAHEGRSIHDELGGARENLTSPKEWGAFPQADNDFGFVSFALHPFAKTSDFVVIYAAGRHGPASAHSAKWLSLHSKWDKHPYGGVFEVGMDVNKPFDDRIQQAQVEWDSNDYSTNEAPVRRTMVEWFPRLNTQTPRVFLSMPMGSGKKGNKGNEKKALWLSRVVEDHFSKKGQSVICEHPFNHPGLDGGWNYVDGILKSFPESKYVIHDVTNFSPGVVFDVGCSIGFGKRVVLLWDRGRCVMPDGKLPKLLERIDVIEVNLRKKEDAREKLDSVLDRLDGAEKPRQCPMLGSTSRKAGSKCPAGRDPLKKKGDPKKVFVVVADQWKNIRSEIIDAVDNLEYSPRVPEDFRSASHTCKLATICKGIAECGHVIVDDTDDDPSGLLVLGIARARERNTFEVYQFGSKGCSMFDGEKYRWREATASTKLIQTIREVLPKLRSAKPKKAVRGKVKK